jgi:hypothetical protein
MKIDERHLIQLAAVINAGGVTEGTELPTRMKTLLSSAVRILGILHLPVSPFSAATISAPHPAPVARHVLRAATAISSNSLPKRSCLAREAWLPSALQ